MLIAGIDEAGRGSLLGPLVVGCVIMSEEDIDTLINIGVKDSKQLSSKKRIVLYEKIRKVGRVYLRYITPKQIDSRKSSINRLELNSILSILKNKKVDKIYIDSFDKPHRLENTIKSMLNYKTELHVEYKADKNHPIVSAASIVAKVNRDREIEKLIKIYGNIGSGYPSDGLTIEFVIKYIKEHGEYPEFVRRSWKVKKLCTLH